MDNVKKTRAAPANFTDLVQLHKSHKMSLDLLMIYSSLRAGGLIAAIEQDLEREFVHNRYTMKHLPEILNDPLSREDYRILNETYNTDEFVFNSKLSPEENKCIVTGELITQNWKMFGFVGYQAKYVFDKKNNGEFHCRHELLVKE